MPDKDPATAAAEAAAKELVKVAYGDLLQPAARVVGAELGEFVQAIVVAGRGFGYLIRETYQPFVLRALHRIPPERRIAPPSEMLGPILEGVTYQRQDSEVSEMFASLLACSMDSERIHEAHPAFVQIVGRLSSDECRILQYLVNNTITSPSVDYDIPRVGGAFSPKTEIAIPSELGVNVAAMELYYENMQSLGLVLRNGHTEDGPNLKKTYRVSLDLTSLGRSLMKACSRAS